jgi:hypothetical protein
LTKKLFHLLLNKEDPILIQTLTKAKRFQQWETTGLHQQDLQIRFRECNHQVPLDLLTIQVNTKHLLYKSIRVYWILISTIKFLTRLLELKFQDNKVHQLAVPKEEVWKASLLLKEIDACLRLVIFGMAPNKQENKIKNSKNRLVEDSKESTKHSEDWVTLFMMNLKWARGHNKNSKRQMSKLWLIWRIERNKELWYLPNRNKRKLKEKDKKK